MPNFRINQTNCFLFVSMFYWRHIIDYQYLLYNVFTAFQMCAMEGLLV